MPTCHGSIFWSRNAACTECISNVFASRGHRSTTQCCSLQASKKLGKHPPTCFLFEIARMFIKELAFGAFNMAFIHQRKWFLPKPAMPFSTSSSPTAFTSILPCGRMTWATVLRWQAWNANRYFSSRIMLVQHGMDLGWYQLVALYLLLSQTCVRRFGCCCASFGLEAD